MYLRETHQKRADSSLVTHLQLAESVWHPHKKRSEVRIVHNCGRAEDPKTAERLRNLARSILKKCDPEEIVQHSTQWRLIDAWPYGALYVLEALWQRLGIAAASGFACVSAAGKESHVLAAIGFLGAKALGIGLAIGALITEIDRRRDGNLSSAIRVHVLEWLLEGGGASDGDTGPPTKCTKSR